MSDCKLNTACSAFRFGGTNVLIENCDFYGPANYLFRGSLSAEEKRSGIIAKNENHRKNMLSAYLYYADYTRPIRQIAGNISVKDCTFTNVDRFLEYNFSGSNHWQTNKPLSDISFKNIKASGIKLPLVLYGDSKCKANLEISDTTVSFLDGTADSFIHVCNFDNITLKNVTVENMEGAALIKKWSDDGKITIDNLVFIGTLEEMAKEEFVCKRI